MKHSALMLAATAALLVCLGACSTNVALREATGATAAQGRKIERWLSSAQVACRSIAVSQSEWIEGMDDGSKAYDLVGADGEMYLLILRREDNDFTAVLDSEGTLLAGMLDNTVLPQYFAKQDGE